MPRKVIAKSSTPKYKYELVVATPPSGLGALQELASKFWISRQDSSEVVCNKIRNRRGLANNMRNALRSSGYSTLVRVTEREGKVFLERK